MDSTNVDQTQPCAEPCELISMLNHIYESVSSLSPKSGSKKPQYDKVLSDISTVIKTLNTDKIIQLTTFINKLDKNIQQVTTTKKPTYAEKTAKKSQTKAIVLEAKDDGENIEEIGKKIKSQFKLNNKINIDSVIVSSNKIRITSAETQLDKKINDVLEAVQVTDKFNIRELEKFKPQISCVVSTDQIDSPEDFKTRNNIPAEEEVTFPVNKEIKTKSRFRRSFIVIRMSKKAREIIQSRGRLYFGAERVSFRDNFYIKSCYKCNRLGLSSRYCESNPTCGNCYEEGHHIGECQKPDNTQKHCLYCKNSGFKNINHDFRSAKCTSYSNAFDRLISVTDYDYEF